MAIRYRIVKARNPITGAGGYRSQPMKAKAVDRHELAKRLSARTSVTRSDVSAVLAELAEALLEALGEGRPVVLDGIGTFYVTIQRSLRASVEDFRPFTNPGVAAIRFRPAREVKFGRRLFEFDFEGGLGNGSSNGQAQPAETGSAGNGAAEGAAPSDEAGKEAAE